jgi:two-component system chemotaxis response regulator CheY
MTPRFCLLADDSPTVRKVARRILQSLGYEVDEAENGLIALDKCAVRMPDVVLLDWNMPVMTGIEFLRTLRATYDGGVPRVVLCTTENSVEHIRDAMAAGADDYIIKPFDATSLRAVLEGTLAVPA